MRFPIKISLAISRPTRVIIFGAVVLTWVHLVYLTWWPGVFTRDSEDIQRQALTGDFNDWHSPLLAQIWQLTSLFEVGLAYDLAIISVQADEMLVPASRLPHSGLPLAELRSKLDPGDLIPLLWSKDGRNISHRINSDNGVLLRAWMNAVLYYPV